jgi:hypothetical protein
MVGAGRAVYDNRVQERALEAMRQMNAPTLPAAAGSASAEKSATQPGEPSSRTPTCIPPARAVSPPTCGPLRADLLLSAEEAATTQTAALRARWSLIYGRDTSSFNLKYLRKACTSPGMNVVRRKRAPPGSRMLVAQTTTEAAAVDVDAEGLSDVDDSDCGLSDHYSVYDSAEEDERMPILRDAQAVRRKADSAESSSEDLCSEDERSLADMRRRLRQKRKASHC